MHGLHPRSCCALLWVALAATGPSKAFQETGFRQWRGWCRGQGVGGPAGAGAGTRRVPLVSVGASDGFDPESESEAKRAARMEQVRLLQRSLYQGETGLELVESGLLVDVPLWRVQWTELPGFQNVLNVWQPHYTHMFMKIVSGPRPWYFGHIFLPGGTENLDKPEWHLVPGSMAPLTGCLMRITDYAQREDGKLSVLVQALEKFHVKSVARHTPYSIATVQLLPDDELVDMHLPKAKQTWRLETGAPSTAPHLDWVAARTAAIAEAFHWHDFEFRDVTLSQSTTGGVSPIAPFDGSVDAPRLAESLSNVTVTAVKRYIKSLPEAPQALLSPEAAASLAWDDILDSPEPSALGYGRSVAQLEYDVWVGLDTMLRLLIELNPNQSLEVPIPTQLLGLIPVNPVEKWPADFNFHTYAADLAQQQQLVGTHTKSAFIHVSQQAPQYPDLRRAQRLSFTVWCLLDALVENSNLARQPLLETRSISQRLRAVVSRLNLINDSLRKYMT